MDRQAKGVEQRPETRGSMKENIDWSQHDPRSISYQIWERGEEYKTLKLLLKKQIGKYLCHLDREGFIKSNRMQKAQTQHNYIKMWNCTVEYIISK